MVERSRDWMKQAERDLENAKYELKGGFYEWACFLSQQAAEKAVKAVFQNWEGRPSATASQASSPSSP